MLNRISHYWHIFLPGIKRGQLYGYRADGPFDPAAGQRFDEQKALIDPYGKGVSVGRNYSRSAACVSGDNASTSMKSVVANLSLFDWENDALISRLFRDTVIYEMHMAGFTRDPSSSVAPSKRGTYLGVIEKIPYLQSLGITAIELLPVYQFGMQSKHLPRLVFPKICPKRPGQGARLLSFGRRGAMARIADRFLQHGHGRRRSSPQLAFASSHE